MYRPVVDLRGVVRSVEVTHRVGRVAEQATVDPAADAKEFVLRKEPVVRINNAAGALAAASVIVAVIVGGGAGRVFSDNFRRDGVPRRAIQ
jgi:hypothetical protein